MLRTLPAILALCGCVGLAFADPIKKAPKVDHEKLSKECAEGFLKAVMDSKADEAIKFFATPFRDHDGKKLESLDKLKKEFERPPPGGAEITVGKIAELSKLNDILKAKSSQELDSDTIKDFETYMGKDGRIVELAVKQGGGPGRSIYALIRVKDGKAHIVGICHGKD